MSGGGSGMTEMKERKCLKENEIVQKGRKVFAEGIKGSGKE